MSALLIAAPFVSADDNHKEIVECLQRLVLTASPGTTIVQLRQQCSELSSTSNDDPLDTVSEQRKFEESTLETNAFTLLKHRPNYLLPVAHNFLADKAEVEGLPDDADQIDSTEFKFRLSFKSLLWDSPFASKAKLYGAYTNTSWWQAYNKDESSPFRETNHEPELFLDIPTDFELGSWELDTIRVGLSHQSNGRSGDASRTWNRIYTEWLFSNDNHILKIKPWESISNMTDNPNIDEFRGRLEVGGSHFLGDHTISWLARHTLDSNGRGAIEADWSFPIQGRQDVRFFLQYFDGYGESLIDYDIRSRRLGFGIKLGNL